jgi:hypothetical protein
LKLESNHHDLVEARQIFQSVLDYEVASLGQRVEERDLAVETFAKQVGSSTKGSVLELVSSARKNRVTLPLSNVLLASETMTNLSFSNSNFEILKRALGEELAKSRELELKRDFIIRGLTELLSGSSIDHIFFKTFNPFGGVGVDVDLIIRRKDFSKCVKLMLENRFVAIDSVSKTYATGFLLAGGGNPIIVDLHTDIAILGVSYLSSETLFANKVQINFESKLEPGKQLKLYVLNDSAAALVAMAHAIIKEGSIRASDLLEVYQAIHSDRHTFSDSVKSAKLVVANELFTFVMNSTFNKKFFNNNGALSQTGVASSSFSSKLAMSFLVKSLGKTITMPVTIPPESSGIAFLDHLRGKGVLGQALPKAISSFKFGRNVARAGQKLMSPFLD